mgnify:CR=1 FL=1
MELHIVAIDEIYEEKELTRTIKVKFRSSFYSGKHDESGGFLKVKWPRIKSQMQYLENELLDDTAIEYIENLPEEKFMRRYELRGLKIENYNIIPKAVKTFGEKSQKMIAIEKMSELIKSLCEDARALKENEFRAARENIAEEIADVFIMLSQLVQIYDSPGWNIGKAIAEKEEKLEKMIQKHNSRLE